MSIDKITTYLEQLELSPLEIKIYLILLLEGELTPQYLIKKLKVHRTSIYPPLESLFSRGLITKSINRKHTKFSITDPEKSLRIILEEFTIQKKEALKEMELALPELLIQFPKISIKEKESYEAETKFYKGKAGVKKIYDDALKTNELRSFVDTAKIQEVFPENFALFNDVFDNRPEVKMFEIFHDSFISNKYLKLTTKPKNYFYKILPKGIKLNAQDILIYENKVAIISFKNDVNGVVLQNEDLYNNLKTIFDLIWHLLPEVKR